jgi:hypothetical protein
MRDEYAFIFVEKILLYLNAYGVKWKKDSTMWHTICSAKTLLYKFQVGIGKAGILLTTSLLNIPIQYVSSQSRIGYNDE